MSCVSGTRLAPARGSRVVLEVTSPRLGLTGPPSRRSVLGGSREVSISLPFSASRGHQNSLGGGTFHLQGQQVVSSVPLCLFLPDPWDYLPPPPRSPNRQGNPTPATWGNRLISSDHSDTDIFGGRRSADHTVKMRKKFTLPLYTVEIGISLYFGGTKKVELKKIPRPQGSPHRKYLMATKNRNLRQ